MGTVGEFCFGAKAELARTRRPRAETTFVRVAQAARRAALPLIERTETLATYLVFHEVDDVQHWLGSPVREQVFGPMGITARTFVDPQGSNRVGLLADIPDMAAFQEMMQTEQAAEAMKQDGVRPETMVILAEG